MKGKHIELPNCYLFQNNTGEIILHLADMVFSIPLSLPKCMSIFSNIEQIPDFDADLFMSFYDNKKL